MKKMIWVLLAGITLWFVVTFKSGQDQSQTTKSPRKATDKGSPMEAQADIHLIEQSPFASEYGIAERSVSDDLKLLKRVIQDCQLLIKDFDRYHLPDNPEIVRFLQGANSDQLAWIPAKHPLIDQKGRLLDRAGIPVVFHRLSGMRFEFRAAGPDRVHWTDDDIIVK